MIDRLIEHDVAVFSAWLDATNRGKGNPTGANQHTRGNGDNITISSDGRTAKKGTSREQALRRLNKLEREGNEEATAAKRA